MNRSLKIVCMLAVGLGTSTVFAQAAPVPDAPATTTAVAPAGPAKIAVIAFQPGVMQTNEGQRSLAEVQRKYEPTQVKLKGLSDEVDSLKKQLQTGGDKLSDTERASRLKTIDTKEKQLQRDAEDAQASYQSDLNDVYSKLAAKVYESLQAYAQQSGYTLVVDISGQQSPVVWAAPGTDITAAVIQAYNVKSGVAAPPANAPSATRTPSTMPRTPGATTSKPATQPKP